MHLKEVHMENFKSFGTKMTVPFRPGYTGITGPNGSGKSNIGDAILFVLGPNSPRAIRAGRLTDLIFNGGSAGKAARSCLVSLTFDNRKREMPVDADDVVLTRRIKAKGKVDCHSYFYVNGRASRKREFVDLLRHARISADGYNITQQGDILRICDISDAKRREILDDISGIKRFDNDISAANKQRDHVDENLDRISIVLEEITGNLRRLDKEKDAAERYRSLQGQISETKGLKAWRRKTDLEEQIGQVQSQITRHAEDRTKLDEQRHNLDAMHKDAQIRFAEIEEEIRKQGGAEVEKIQGDLQAARDGMVRLEEKIQFAKDQLTGGDEDLLPFHDELRRIEKTLNQTKTIQAEGQAEFEAKDKALKAKRQSLQDLRDFLSRSDDGAMAINRELAKLKTDHEAAQIALHEASLAEDRLQESVRAVERQHADLSSELETVSTDLKETSWEAEELRKTAGGGSKRRKEIERRMFELRKAQAELGNQNEDFENRIRRLTREMADLQAQEAAHARATGGAGRAVQEIIQARDDGSIRGIVGTISELASVDKQHETALQTAAGASINAILVEDDGVAAECIELLKRTKAGRAKLLPLNKMVPGRPRGQALMKVKKDGCLGFALDLIDFNERYRNAFWNVFGDTLVASNMEAGRRLMGGVRIVSLDGELFEAGGAMIGGSRGKKSGPSFSNADRGRIDGLMAKIQETEAAQDDVLTRWQNVKAELLKLEEEQATAGDHMHDEDRLKDLEKRETNLKTRQATLQEELAGLTKARDETQVSMEAKQALQQEHKARLEGFETLREEKSRLLLKGTKKEKRDEIEALEKAVDVLREESLEAKKRSELAAGQLTLVEARRKEVADHIADSGSDREKFEKQIIDLGKLLEKAAAEVKALNEMERKATEKLGGLRGKRDKVVEEVADLKAKVEKLQDRMQTNADLAIRAKGKLPELEETLAEAMLELDEHPVDVAADQDVPPFDELRRRLRGLESSLERLGPVNMRALEEFEDLTKRKQGLDDEVERLQTQREELETLVAEIVTKKTGVFMEVYEAVNRNFTEVYQELSLGGKALMELENATDPFEGGLILKAQPRGKRVTRLNALSGGEKSLTSMAFIFALQRYDPSPFYYFDEVDQNLDAVNSELLAKLVQKNAQFAQFIQVSLRKITLKECNALYGVTQQVAGISDIIADFSLGEVKESWEEAPKNGKKFKKRPSDDGTLSEAIGDMMEVEVGV